MKRWALRAAALVAAVAAAGFLVAASGVIPIKASSGHWPITRWLLEFGMHRSFATHSLGVKAPPLDDPDLVLKGATHYDFGCRSCHGSPGGRPPRIAQSMTPRAPALAPEVPGWSDEQLFSLVKHGVKFTGMPAWPAQQRDDEVWAMVAFLRRLPELEAESYRELVDGPAVTSPPIQELEPAGAAGPAPVAALRTCLPCHGADGMGRNSTVFPKLAGQRREYLAAALSAYATGRRGSGIMEPIAAGLTDEVLGALAAYYAELPRRQEPARSPEVDPRVVELGREIAHEGRPARRIPACVECHGPAGHRTKPVYPLLAGQPAAYLTLQLKLFKEGRRGGSDHAHLMQHVAPHLSLEEMHAVSVYFESLPLEVESD